MMPGDNQSKTVAIAADATVGNCQNCSVLQQSLSEYVSSFLALKQKITISDDSIRLQQQLEELKIKLVTLEKKTADYESVQAELEEKKGAQKAYEQMSEEMEKLKQQNSQTVAEKNQLEDQLKEAKEMTETQSLDNARLKREKAVVENDLLQVQASLKKSQAQVDVVEKLTEENAKTTNMNKNLENKLKSLEDSICKQNHQVSQLTKEKTLLERHVDDLQARLVKLERERCKDYRSSSTQASAPEEPKIDKEKIRMLIEDLWACVDPQQQHTANLMHLPVAASTYKQALLSSPQSKLHSNLSNTSPKTSDSHSYPVPTKAPYTQLKTPPRGVKATKHQASAQSPSAKDQTGRPKKRKRQSKEDNTVDASEDMATPQVSLEEIMELFKSFPPCISPIPDLVESMETDDLEREKSPEPSDDAVLLQRVESSVITTTLSDDSPKSSAPAAEKNVDSSAVTTQEMADIPNEGFSKDLGQNKSSNITATMDKNRTDDEMHIETEMQTKSDLTPSLSSSSTSDITILVEPVSLRTESQEPSCSPNSFSETQIASEGEAQSETITKMDVNTSSDDAAVGKTVTCDNGKSPSGSTMTAVSKEADVQLITPCVTSSTFVDSVRDVEVTDTGNGSEMGKSKHDSCALGQSSLDASTSKPKDDKECLSEDKGVPEVCRSGSSDGISSISKENIEERLETDTLSKHLEDADENETQRTGEAHVLASLSKLNGDNRSSSPHKLPLLKMDNGESHANQESDQVNVEPPSKKVYEQALDSKILADKKSSPDPKETTPVSCDSLTGKTHALCRQLSPTYLYPTVKLQTLEDHTSLEKVHFDIDNKIVSSAKETAKSVPSLEEEGVSKNTINLKKGSTQDWRDTSNQNASRCKLHMVNPTTSSQQSASNGQNEGLESCTKSPQKISREQVCPVAGSTTGKPQEFIGHVRSEMGPPLPRLLTPVVTPPKAGKSINPRHAIGKLSFPSPMERLASPTTPVQAHLTPNGQHLSPLPTNGVPSSPLQFGSATPKHAVPVPGRLPLTAMTSSPSSSSSPSQESSMRILDTMYPELSAHARTLNILRGNVSLNMCSPESRSLPTTAVSQMSGFKTINSTSTAFTKTEMRGEKIPSFNFSKPKSSKCLRLDDTSPTITRKQMPCSLSKSGEETAPAQASRLSPLTNEAASTPMEVEEPAERNLIDDALNKIEKDCFDLLPVIQSHLYVGNLPKKPVLRNEEKEVISEICSLLKADEMVAAILNKLKAEKRTLSLNYMQALCRVHTAICRQRGDWEKARILAYSILAEDFPDCAKLILFMVTTWPSVLSHSSSLCQAIHTVTKLKAPENLISCLSAFLNWEKSPPCDIDSLISTTLSDVRSGSNPSFTKHSRHGPDLATEAWEHVWTLHLLCAQKNWKWTYDNVLSKELWPLMNAWVAQPRDQQTSISDVTVSTVLRLIGRLGQVGIKQRCAPSVVTIANTMNAFGRHGPAEGVPWEVQLAAVYCIYELSPSNPKQALDALAGWRSETSQSVPPAVTSCINQLASICRQINN